MEYLNDLQVLRGISIIFIILFHYNVNKNGYRGVDIFILISGFLIYNNYEKRCSLFSFYVNRIARIIILSYFIQFVTLLYFCIYDLYNIQNIIHEYNNALLLRSNIYYYKIGNDYFLSNTNKVFLHYWYISMDTHFYIFYPIFHDNHFFYLVVFYIIHVYTYILNKPLLYYLLIYRLYEFLLGNTALLYRIINNDNIKYITTFLILYFIIYNFSCSYISYILIVICTFFYLINKSQGVNISIIEKIGDVSYVLYLIHYPVSLNNKSLILLLIIIPICLILNTAERTIIIYLKKGNMACSSTFIIIYYAFFRIISYSISKRTTKEKYVNKIKIFDENCCDRYTYSKNDIMIVGDSHAYRFLNNILMKIYVKGINVYWKYITTKWIIQNSTNFIYNIKHDFYLIISMSMISYRWYNFCIDNLTNHYYSYIHYLKSKCKYLILYKPTPTFNNSMDCITQMKKKVGIIGYNISNIELQFNNMHYNDLIIKDLSKYYCYKRTCNLTYNNKCIYGDDNHLNPSFLNEIFTDEKNDLYHYYPPMINNNSTCNSYIIYNNIMPYNWLFIKNKCIKSYYKKEDL